MPFQSGRQGLCTYVNACEGVHMHECHVIAFTCYSHVSYNFTCRSHRADCRISTRRIVPLEVLYASVLHWMGWNSADVMTSANRKQVFYNEMSQLLAFKEVWITQVLILYETRSYKPQFKKFELANSFYTQWSLIYKIKICYP